MKGEENAGGQASSNLKSERCGASFKSILIGKIENPKNFWSSKCGGSGVGLRYFRQGNRGLGGIFTF